MKFTMFTALALCSALAATNAMAGGVSVGTAKTGKASVGISSKPNGARIGVTGQVGKTAVKSTSGVGNNPKEVGRSGVTVSTKGSKDTPAGAIVGGDRGTRAKVGDKTIGR